MATNGGRFEYDMDVSGPLETVRSTSLNPKVHGSIPWVQASLLITDSREQSTDPGDSLACLVVSLPRSSIGSMAYCRNGIDGQVSTFRCVNRRVHEALSSGCLAVRGGRSLGKDFRYQA